MDLEKLLGRNIGALYCSKCTTFKTMTLGDNSPICTHCGEKLEVCSITIDKYRGYLKNE